MGFFGKVFSGISIKNQSTPKGKISAMAHYGLHKKGGFTGGYGADRFRSIIEAHSSAEELALEFEMYKENNAYSPEAYEEAYAYFYDLAEIEYREWVDFYLELIEMNEGIIMDLQIEIDSYNSEIDECESEISQLESEIEALEMELDFCEDPDEIEEIQDEIHDCQDQIEELEQRISECESEIGTRESEIIDLEFEIMDWQSEMEALTIEEFMPDEKEIEDLAFEYAIPYAQDWIDGSVYIPFPVISHAFYEISDHNR